MCVVRLLNGKKSKDVKQMLGLEETVYQLVVANGISWYEPALRRKKNIFLSPKNSFYIMTD